ncbi:MAG TPA: UDP-N-acetylmuramate dehydrogenase [Gammaproteobacteria bacterium]|nr:UDP-N-acetylmuramate dehydrogenase [Gammaproteobacteria bacterium]HIL18029.1 UDP-N-acetylmuramate dehydrogenase [Gammaproteobacteria bacterium]
MNASFSALSSEAARGLRGRLLCDEPLAAHTSWRVGGPADYFFVPSDREDLGMFLAMLPVHVPLLWVGLGSNLLVRDGGYRGAVICTHKGLGHSSPSGSSGYFAEAGVPCAKMARHSAQIGRCGAEFLSGIPGTIGGALAMNAGAYGHDIWSIVKKVELIDRQGQLYESTRDAFKIDYRSVAGHGDCWFLNATFDLTPGNKEAAQGAIRTLLQTRGREQPIQERSAGSVFKNPNGDFAARLIEAAGLKGQHCGGARVSIAHANFIINDGSATALQIECLIKRIQQAVAAFCGVELEREVHIVGDS